MFQQPTVSALAAFMAERLTGMAAKQATALLYDKGVDATLKLLTGSFGEGITAEISEWVAAEWTQAQEAAAAFEACFLTIAKKHFHVQTLETRNSDRLDFHSVSAASMRDAIREAFIAGFQIAAKSAKPDPSAPDIKVCPLCKQSVGE